MPEGRFMLPQAALHPQQAGFIHSAYPAPPLRSIPYLSVPIRTSLSSGLSTIAQCEGGSLGEGGSGLFTTVRRPQSSRALITDH